MKKDTLSSGYVAKVLGISPRTARRYITQGKIPAVQNPLTRRWTISPEALTSFMDRHLPMAPLPASQPLLLVGFSPHPGKAAELLQALREVGSVQAMSVLAVGEDQQLLHNLTSRGADSALTAPASDEQLLAAIRGMLAALGLAGAEEPAGSGSDSNPA